MSVLQLPPDCGSYSSMRAPGCSRDHDIIPSQPPQACSALTIAEASALCLSQEARAFQASSIVGPTIPLLLYLRDNQVDTPQLSNEQTLRNVANDRTYKPTVTCSSADVLPLLKTPERFWFRCAGAFFALFTAGWADGVTGAILPHIKEDFDLSYMTSSLLFLTSSFGFALGVIVIEQVTRLLGRFHFSRVGFRRTSMFQGSNATRKTTQASSAEFVATRSKEDEFSSPARARFRILVIGSIFHASFFVLMGTANGLSNVLAAYFLASFGKALLNGTVNAYVAASPKRPLGQLYACNSTENLYSLAIGAFAAPFVCQTLLARNVPWSHFYLGSLILSATNTVLLSLAFRPTRKESIEEGNVASTYNGTCLEERKKSNDEAAEGTDKGRPIIDHSSITTNEKSLTSNALAISPPLAGKRDRSSLRYALKLRYVWAFSTFMWIYSGSETSTQGYIATYLLAVRNGNPNTVGYVTSGFWGGMAISRFITGFASPYLSFKTRKHTIHVILVIALSMHFCIWFVNSEFENALSTGIIGLAYGPVYPSVLALAVDLLPGEAHMIAMAVIAGFANLGSSIFPFIAGATSNLQGPKVLVYMTVAQTVTLIVLWMFFPAKSPLHH